MLKELKVKGLLLGVASNRPTRFTHIILKHLRIHQTFDCVICADKVARPKPAAEILERILKKFSLIPGQVLYVGDMIVDMETGNNAGIKTVAVTTGSSTKEEIAQLNPHEIISNVFDVASIVATLNDRKESLK